MTERRKALLVATDTYADATFQKLRSPEADADALASVLSHPAIGGYSVRVVHNRRLDEVTLAIEDLFTDSALDDLILLHVSGHGVKDDAGQLFLPTADSRHDRLDSTAVNAGFVRTQMAKCRSRRVIVWLDCCYAGAFPAGMAHRAGAQVDVLEQLGGRGRVVMTSSTALQYSYEAAPVTNVIKLKAAVRKPGPSVFTSALTEGMRTGSADLDGDGEIEIHELYDYVYRNVSASSGGRQTPTLSAEVAGRLVVAKSVRGTAYEPILREDRPSRRERTGFIASVRRSRRRQVIVSAVLVVILTAIGLSAPIVVQTLDARSATQRTDSTPPGAELDNPVVIKTGHFGPSGVDSVVFSPDCRVIATGGTPDVIDDDSVRLWDVTTHQRLEILNGGTAPVAFSPGGTVLASGDAGDTARLWDLTSYAQTAALSTDNLTALAFVPGTDTLVGGNGTGRVEVWDSNSRQLVKSVTGPVGVDSLVFGKNGDIITAGIHVDTDNGNNVQVWNVMKARTIAAFPGASEPIALSPDGRILATGAFLDSAGSAYGLEVWNVSTQKVIAVPLPKGDTSLSITGDIAFSSDGRMLAIGGTDQRIHLFRVSTDGDNTTITQTAILGGIENPADNTTSLAFSPDDHKVAAGDNVGTLRLWDISGLR